jgi:hypothetical protein
MSNLRQTAFSLLTPILGCHWPLPYKLSRVLFIMSRNSAARDLLEALTINQAGSGQNPSRLYACIVMALTWIKVCLNDENSRRHWL